MSIVAGEYGLPMKRTCFAFFYIPSKTYFVLRGRDAGGRVYLDTAMPGDANLPYLTEIDPNNINNEFIFGVHKDLVPAENQPHFPPARPFIEFLESEPFAKKNIAIAKVGVSIGIPEKI